jgi:DNA polymerase III alpha subunit
MEISEIKKHVTHFSLELKHNAAQEEEVVVGGRVTSVIPPVNEEYPMYIVMLDDTIGVTHVFVPDSMMTEFHSHFQKDNYVFVEGFVNFITRQGKKEVMKDVSVFAFALKDITTVGDTI